MARALVSCSCGLVDISTSTRFSPIKFESPNSANCSDALIYPSRMFEKHQRRRQHRKRTRVTASPSVRMVSNGYFGREKYTMKDNFNRIYKRVGSCLVIPPPKGKKPKAIIQFLGGAFIGAVPEVSYSYLLGLLANEGYLIISVPYNVTFDHSQAAREIYERFHACFDVILTSGLPDAGLTAAELADLPLYSVGHRFVEEYPRPAISFFENLIELAPGVYNLPFGAPCGISGNGALLQVLTGSYFSEKIPKANAIISYNNRPATEAVPYFEQLGPLVSQMMPVVEASPMSSMARSASDVWKVLLDTAGAMASDYDPEAMVSLNKFADQLPSVFNQVAQGISEFKPTPSENRDFFKKSYNVQRTLLVKFNSDAIDETDLLEETLKSRVESIGGTLEKVSLSGNHITPCIQEPKWQVGYLYTPADAIAQGLKTISLNDTKVLSTTIVHWLSHLDR